MVRRYGNRLQCFAYRERRRWSLFSTSTKHPLSLRLFSFSSMPRPRALELAASRSAISRKNFRSPRPLPSPLMKGGTWRQSQYFMKIIGGKIAHGPNKSKPGVNSARKRLLRRGLYSSGTRRAVVLQSRSEEAPQPESMAIILPQPPLLSFAYLYPESDSGYCSDSSRSSSPSPQPDGTERPTRRYIRPDLSEFGSPCDLVCHFRVRLSARLVPPTLLRPTHCLEPF
ncbi:hypothetical protein DFH06DRAFT_1172900 [Mycena polygramma]|nr:hypothetical protein DFH06DRAFT_1172900 [Mycena polygramma]